ncbi:uncharacterized protein LOC125469228 [Pyrus x bretschneideri]|uniref:uncharacterized protein LOC125469228 n=1 Tax=Pyrus x bretschneideri TaxID=225117 RepID=UPI00202E35CC|nr:uncharacterized protein LOC125469228 [Pyrus x bretschneideri]
MVNLAKLDFVVLDITGKNYLTWVVDVDIHLEAGNLVKTIKEENNASSQDRAKAMILICRHLDKRLKSEYLTVEDPLALLKALRNKYNHQKMVVDVNIHLEAENLAETIKEENNASSQDRANAMIPIRRHLDERLKSEYLTVEDLLAL